MKTDIQINQLFLMALSEPEYSRIDFWITQRENTTYRASDREYIYCIKLLEAHEYFCKKIESEVSRLKGITGSEISDFKLPLLNETNGELTGHIGMPELNSLYGSIQELVRYYKINDDDFINPAWIDQNESKKEFKFYSIQPIKWLSSEHALRQLIDGLINNEMIQKREAEDIIQHFAVSGREANETQSEPIRWEHEIRYLAYLIHRLGEELFINLKDSKHKLTVLHFADRDGLKLKENSLSSSLSTLLRNRQGRDKTVLSIDAIIDGLNHN